MLFFAASTLQVGGAAMPRLQELPYLRLVGIRVGWALAWERSGTVGCGMGRHKGRVCAIIQPFAYATRSIRAMPNALYFGDNLEDLGVHQRTSRLISSTSIRLSTATRRTTCCSGRRRAISPTPKSKRSTSRQHISARAAPYFRVACRTKRPEDSHAKPHGFPVRGGVGPRGWGSHAHWGVLAERGPFSDVRMFATPTGWAIFCGSHQFRSNCRHRAGGGSEKTWP